MASSSSAHNQQNQPFPNLYGGATSAPPPTPSTNLSNNNNNLFSTSAAADALSHLLNRLPPTLSLPITRRSSPTSTCPPSFSLSSNQVLSSVSKLGFAQLTDHSLTSELANSAESEALALFEFSRTQKESLFPKNNWPFGYEPSVDDEDDENRLGESFRFDSSCSTESTQLELTCLREFARALEKLGIKIIDSLTDAMGLENPVGDDPTRFCSVMWVSECQGQPGISCGFYPFIVGLQYQLRCQKYSLLSDSGWVSVLPHVDSILVTVGDIAQVWSNGKLKKVRGRPVATVGGENDARCITMSLLITLPTESNVAPLLPNPKATIDNSSSSKEQKEEDDEEKGGNTGGGEELEREFNSFDFEDYAWRVYHERLSFKDPLDRYRVI